MIDSKILRERPEEVLAIYRDRLFDEAAVTTAQEVLKHVARLWGFGVHLESTNAKGDVTKRWTVPAPAQG